MKKKFSWLILVIAVSGSIFAIDQPKPMMANLKIGDRLELDGELILFNGWPPNIRFVTIKNEIVGIGTGESAYVPEEIEGYLAKEYENKLTLEVRFIRAVKLPYYEQLLPCFEIVKILRGVVRKDSTENWKAIPIEK